MSSTADKTFEGAGGDQKGGTKQQHRWAVCLNEPTVASLRKRAAVSTRHRFYNTTSMPVTTGSQSFLSSLPTFMSVFGGEEEGKESHAGSDTSYTTNLAPHAPARTNPLNRSTSYQGALSSSHARRTSTATARSESTEPSPTMTVSTVDSTLTDPSPSSSPESPNLLLPSLSRQKDPNQTPRNPTMEHSGSLSLTPSPTRQEERAGSPNKRPRNTKNLSINTTGISTKQAPHTAFASAFSRQGESSTSSLPAVANSRILSTAIPNHVAPAGHPQGGKDSAARPFSEPSSPSFIGPSMQPPRRSKLGLTISTTDSRSPPSQPIPETPLRAVASLPLRTRASDLGGKLSIVPGTPAYGPLSAMREGDDAPLFSPSMAPNGGMKLPPFGSVHEPTLPTPSFGPEGGMQFPSRGGSTESSPYMKTARPPLDIPRHAFQSPQSSSVIQHTVEHNPSTPLHELPLSREAKSPGYPDGPICIYPPSVYLYHQPTKEEARDFDVIINVAREVANPFLEEEKVDTTDASISHYKDIGVQCTILPGPEKEAEKPLPSAASDASFTSALEDVSMEDEGPETPRAALDKQVDPEYVHLPWEHNSKVYEEWLRVCELIDNRVMKGKRVLVHCQLGVSRSASLIVAYGLYKNPRLTPDEAREQAKRQSKYIDLNMHFMYELGDFKKLLVEKFPASQTAKRPGGHKGLSRTMTDSVLVTQHQSTKPMSPIADEGEEDVDSRIPSPTKAQYANAPNVDSNGPSSAPAGTQRSPGDTPSENHQERGNENQQTITGDSLQDKMGSSDVSNTSPEPDFADQAPLVLKLPKTKPPRIQSSIDGESTHAPPSLNIHSVNASAVAQNADVLPPTNLYFPKADNVSVQNSAQGRDSLPPPNFSLPSGTPRRSLRPMPSLPAGFNSVLPKRSPPTQFPLSGGLSLNIAGISPAGSPTTAEPDLLSPRAAEFTANPFHQTIAGDLAESSLAMLQSPRDPEIDPRSPPTRGEAAIVRNIDDVLK